MSKIYIAEQDNIVNPNLLDNWYFGNPVNQRGLNEYNTPGYTIDRWHNRNSQLIIKLEDDGLRIDSNGASASSKNFNQRFENFKDLLGKQVTLSAIIEEFSGSGNLRLSLYGGDVVQNVTEMCIAKNFTNTGLITVSGIIPEKLTNSSGINFSLNGVNMQPGDTVKIKAVKLELGNKQTLAHQDSEGNWILNEIPNYGDQLVKCQRYQYVLNSNSTRRYPIFGTGIGITSKRALIYITMPITMYRNPLVTYSGLVELFDGKNSINIDDTVTNEGTPANSNENIKAIFIDFPEDVITPSQTYIFRGTKDETCKLIVDANL